MTPAVARVRGAAIVAGLRLLGTLPDGMLLAAADSVGELWYRLTPARAARARANLGRVCGNLAATGRGTALARRAAGDPRALERLVRRCYRQTARYYVEVARLGSATREKAIARMEVVAPAVVDEALDRGSNVIIVGMHFGAIELPVIYLSSRLGHPFTAPMETVDDPAVQAWFLATRGEAGVRIVPLRDARRAMVAALRAGESVGIVNDRDITGSGLPVPFFGHPAPMSPGPAMLALESGTPLYVGSARRTPDGHYLGRLLPVEPPAEGSRRERMLAMHAAMAAAMEELLAEAPEQWWGAFHRIWPDLDPDPARDTAVAA